MLADVVCLTLRALILCLWLACLLALPQSKHLLCVLLLLAFPQIRSAPPPPPWTVFKSSNGRRAASFANDDLASAFLTNQINHLGDYLANANN